MKKLLNNLYITKDGSRIHKEGETIVVKQDGKKVFQAPIRNFQGIYCFGRVSPTHALMSQCGQLGIELAFFSKFGKFKLRVLGPQSGNVLLRRAQYRCADDAPARFARIFVAAKIASSRFIVMKQIRNHGGSILLERSSIQLGRCLRKLENTLEVEKIRGIEGEAAAIYFSTFNEMFSEKSHNKFQFSGRTRRPPRDRVNAMLSFAYTLLTSDIASALQGVGLDPYVGFLHADRSGRFSLALDVLEEFRAWWCDRFVITLINRNQIKHSEFVVEASGAVRMNNEARKKFLASWQKKKQRIITHPFINEKVPIGLLPHVQANLMAKNLRGDLANYPPFFAK